MKLADHLNANQKEQLNKIKAKKRKRTKKKKPEKVDWAEIMGTNRDTYRRGKGGAIRRK